MYEEHFQLKETPFNITPDPKYIFFSKKHLEAFSSLLYGIESRKGFIAITGEIGAGKTTLCRVLLEELKGRAKTSIILNPNLSETELLLSIVQDFGIQINGRNKKVCFDALNQFLLHEFHNGFNVVLIIDEAQDLKAKALEQVRLISNLETASEKLLQIVLVGQPELKTTLNSPSLKQLRQRIGVWYHLTTLDRNEVIRYIGHRLSVAGWRGLVKDIFDDSAISTIYGMTEGIPRLINILCDRAMLAAYAKGVKSINGAIIEEANSELQGVMAAS
ncbi:MAG: ATPase [Candidatus Omnitrophica bacterium CG11_big_fil_rev_8_21_14_0_20_45_26]|uniref:ATPase n=1 Tax=Candidatus Abzuiibacterium crystallinum TaxID=1974748 RepID=A0A2H0LSR9_9BACT|nr:MAG: ATPase [Candidatus Omnitrophica bacterium CG11_big_fil_rev_8_21_14_0_20_45_26]PIW64938.1 MAG: ATPase [Candidatus Omnitrophica bacterium CG12_big_fil_rev_8_21_14_0_65_45_16]